MAQKQTNPNIPNNTKTYYGCKDKKQRRNEIFESRKKGQSYFYTETKVYVEVTDGERAPKFARVRP